MSSQVYLTSKNGQYYFRIAIPKELRSKIHKSELIYSLRTKCRYEAKARCITMLGKTQLLFKKFQNMPRLTPEKAKEIVKSYFKEALACLEQQMNAVDDYSDMLASVPHDNALDLTGDRHRLDFLYPDRFYDNKGDAALGLQEHDTPDLGTYIKSKPHYNRKSPVRMLYSQLRYHLTYSWQLTPKFKTVVSWDVNPYKYKLANGFEDYQQVDDDPEMDYLIDYIDGTNLTLDQLCEELRYFERDQIEQACKLLGKAPL